MGHNCVVSVIIPTWNQTELLARSVRSVLSSQVRAKLEMEIIVVDQNPRRIAEQVLEESELIRCKNVRYIHTDRRGEGQARNIGAKVAAGDYIACVDDDCEVSPEWARDIASQFEDTTIDVLCAPLVEPDQSSTRGYTPKWYPTITGALSIRTAHLDYFGVSANMVITRRAFELLHGFDPALGAGSALGAADDIDFIYRAIRRGFIVVNSDKPYVLHHGVRVLDSDVRALHRRNWIGTGSMYMKYVRVGDTVMIMELLRNLVIQPTRSLSYAARTKSHPRGLGSNIYLMLGAIRSLKYPIDTNYIVYRLH